MSMNINMDSFSKYEQTFFERLFEEHTLWDLAVYKATQGKVGVINTLIDEIESMILNFKTLIDKCLVDAPALSLNEKNFIEFPDDISKALDLKSKGPWYSMKKIPNYYRNLFGDSQLFMPISSDLKEEEMEYNGGNEEENGMFEYDYNSKENLLFDDEEDFEDIPEEGDDELSLFLKPEVKLETDIKEEEQDNGIITGDSNDNLGE